MASGLACPVAATVLQWSCSGRRPRARLKVSRSGGVGRVCRGAAPGVVDAEGDARKKNIGAIGRQGVVVLPPVWLMSKATPEERRRR